MLGSSAARGSADWSRTAARRAAGQASLSPQRSRVDMPGRLACGAGRRVPRGNAARRARRRPAQARCQPPLRDPQRHSARARRCTACLQLRHRAGVRQAHDSARCRGCPKSRPGVIATWARRIMSKQKSQLLGAMRRAVGPGVEGAVGHHRHAQAERVRAPARGSRAGRGTRARRRSYSAIDSASKQASAACCASVEGQM